MVKPKVRIYRYCISQSGHSGLWLVPAMPNEKLLKPSFKVSGVLSSQNVDHKNKGPLSVIVKWLSHICHCITLQNSEKIEHGTQALKSNIFGSIGIQIQAFWWLITGFGTYSHFCPSGILTFIMIKFPWAKWKEKKYDKKMKTTEHDFQNLIKLWHNVLIF